jgi:hypothetical protein
MPRATARGRIRRHQRHATAATGSNGKNGSTPTKQQAVSAARISSPGGNENSVMGNNNSFSTNSISRGAGADDVMMAIDEEEFRDDDDSSSILETNKRKGVLLIPVKAKKRRLMELSSLAAMASRPFAILKNRPPASVSYTTNSPSATFSGEAPNNNAAQHLEEFQHWFVEKTKSKEWRQVNSAMIPRGDDTGCLPGDSVTVFSFQQQQGNLLGGNAIVVGAIILSRQQQQNEQQRNRHRVCYYDKSCRVFLEIDEHTGNVVRQWTNLPTHSATDVLLYWHMLERLLCQTHE